MIMYIRDLINERNISVYELSKKSNIPYTTLNDVVKGKTQLKRCSAETVYKLSKALHISMEELMDDLNDYVESIDDDLSALEGERDDDDFHMIDDDEFEDEYLDDMEDGEDHLHLLNGNASGCPENVDAFETLAVGLCPECGRMFFVGTDDPEDARYTCPHCKKLVSPTPLTPENAPIARPEK